MREYFGARYFDKEVEIKQRKEREEAEKKRVAREKKMIEEEIVDGSLFIDKIELTAL
jgi:hypothetical protein